MYRLASKESRVRCKLPRNFFLTYTWRLRKSSAVPSSPTVHSFFCVRRFDSTRSPWWSRCFLRDVRRAPEVVCGGVLRPVWGAKSYARYYAHGSHGSYGLHRLYRLHGIHGCDRRAPARSRGGCGCGAARPEGEGIRRPPHSGDQEVYPAYVHPPYEFSKRGARGIEPRTPSIFYETASQRPPRAVAPE
jgi:hypothetical protein